MDAQRIAKLNTLTAEIHFLRGTRAEEAGNKDEAIGAYQDALGVEPAHEKSITALGRLRFKPPPQPVLDVLRKVVNRSVCEVMIEIRNPCNYRCFYCVAKGANNTPVQTMDLARIASIYAGIKADLIVTTFECGGGEPTVHPQFPELVRLASQYGAVSFPSNNSQDPARWLPKETAARLFIRSALHPESEENIERYLKYARYLVDAGCRFQAQFICHPTRVGKVREYQKLFEAQGLTLQPTAFIGVHEGKRYPPAHSEEEKEIIGLNTEERYWMNKIEPQVTRTRFFRGIPCLAGFQSLYITAKGELRRCPYDGRALEKPLEAAKPCGVAVCGCGLLLEKLNSLEAGFYNDWAEMAGRETIPIALEQLAAEHGYTSFNNAAAAEQGAMYEALMEAYGKNEFPERRARG